MTVGFGRFTPEIANLRVIPRRSTAGTPGAQSLLVNQSIRETSRNAHCCHRDPSDDLDSERVLRVAVRSVLFAIADGVRVDCRHGSHFTFEIDFASRKKNPCRGPQTKSVRYTQVGCGNAFTARACVRAPDAY